MSRNRLVLTLLLTWALPLAAREERNLIPNASFEAVTEDGRPEGWQWFPGRAGGTLTVDGTIARTGQRSVQITNPTPQEPHVYSHLALTVPVQPNTTYTLSCYVRSDGPGTAWIGGGPGWTRRYAFPATGGEWVRVTGSFTTEPGERDMLVLILSESPTEGLWVDDVQLERGEEATEFMLTKPLEPGETQLWIEPMVVGENLLPNSSFEVIDGNRPKFWSWDQRNTDATLTLDRTVARSGQVSLKFTNGTPFGAHIYGLFSLLGGVATKPNTTYTVSAYVRSDGPGTAWIGGATGWRVRAPFPRTQVGSATPSQQWARVSQTFITNEDETNVPLLIVTESPTQGIWVDDVKLEEGPEATPYLPVGAGLRASPDEEAGLRASPAATPHLDLTPTLPRPVEYGGYSLRPVWKASLYPPQEVAFISREFWAAGFLFVPEAVPGATLRVTFTDADGKTLAEATEKRDLPAGAQRLDFGWGLPPFPAPLNPPKVGGKGGGIEGGPGGVGVAEPRLVGQLQAVLTAADGTEVARSATPVQAITGPAVEKQLATVEDLLAQLRERLKALADAGRDPAYPQVTATVLENFLPYAREDLAHHEIGRAWDAALVMEEMARKALKSDWTPSVPRYVTSPIRIDGPSFIAHTSPATHQPTNPPTHQPVTRHSSLVTRPVFFIGYGHFGSVRRDLEKFPGYGVNLIQIEFGPNSVLTSEEGINNGAVEDFLAVCDRAAKVGVSVNLLLSPHYFPGWALEKWPHLTDCSGGFLRYCVHAPESRGVLERFLRHVIPQIKDHPALHSLCLSNEPVNIDLSQCREAQALWREWLRREHGDAATLNQRWGTNYAAFDEVPVPGPQFEPTPPVYDFVRFNQETFAGWHRWMADVIHEMAPNVPVHAKIMMGAHFGRSLGGIWSVDPELFGALSQINGNDDVRWYVRQGEWASEWQLELMGYDFQRSVADLPVFNSENHLIPDRNTDVVPPEYVQNVLWQGAVHGQSATTIWVWERTFDPTSDFAGSIMHRPDCAAAVGTTCHDLNRLAEEVTALQCLEPPVVLLWSLASTVYGGPHEETLRRVYAALNFTGVPLGFVTERQLGEGRGRKGTEGDGGEGGGEKRTEGDGKGQGVADTLGTLGTLGTPKVIIVPAMTHASEATLEALRRLAAAGVKVVRVGECFGRTEYNAPRDTGTPLLTKEAAKQGEVVWEAPQRTEDLLPRFEAALADWGVARRIQLRTPDGQPVWGVEMRAALCPEGEGRGEKGKEGERGEGGSGREGKRWIVNLSNYLREPQRVQLLRDGKAVKGRDLLNGEELGETFEVASLVPRLVEVTGDE